MVCDPLPSDHNESEQPIMSNIVAENRANADSEEAKDCKIEGKEAEDCKIEDKEAEDCKIEDKEAEDQKIESKSSMKSKDDYNIENVKRAAVTAISAAAVKAKILANQEEDQILQLATSLVEKQLHKLETKLTFFAEMESAIMRVREQLERSKQKLYHERAQIIVARLGLSASSCRPMQQPLPSNKAAISFANSVPRPPMSTTSQKPPISRPVMASAPPSHPYPFAPATTAANSVLPSNQDKLSSARMK
ncbi:hypothetical protein RJ640_000665 [Escallonia rubra]|uniref:SMARCC C-terminal domain-containing protein n=1 Tax=Escallonia rubra TaxID=112253 RepID=A0AA88UFQ3_9ASTE|nr:hypothetical protein RJ640_000665 [Escallonia rubra]